MRFRWTEDRLRQLIRFVEAGDREGYPKKVLFNAFSRLMQGQVTERTAATVYYRERENLPKPENTKIYPDEHRVLLEYYPDSQAHTWVKRSYWQVPGNTEDTVFTGIKTPKMAAAELVSIASEIESYMAFSEEKTREFFMLEDYIGSELRELRRLLSEQKRIVETSFDLLKELTEIEPEAVVRDIPKIQERLSDEADRGRKSINDIEDWIRAFEGQILEIFDRKQQQ